MELKKLLCAILYKLVAWKYDTLPDREIWLDGEVYMKRWYLIPRNRFFQIYVHEIVRSDRDRELHDHPSSNISFILDGSYREYFSRPSEIGVVEHLKTRRPGYIGYRAADMAHCLELAPDIKRVRTIFVTGRERREWGFWTKEGWVPHYDFRKREGITR